MSVRSKLKQCQDPKFRDLSEYILNYNKGYENLCSKELIEQFYISSAGISKFVKRLGVSSFPELKYNLLAAQKVKEANQDNILKDLIIPDSGIEEYELLCDFFVGNIKFKIFSESEFTYVKDIIENNFKEQIESSKYEILILLGNPNQDMISEILDFNGYVFIIGAKEKLYFCPGLEKFKYIRYENEAESYENYMLNFLTYFLYDVHNRKKKNI